MDNSRRALYDPTGAGDRPARPAARSPQLEKDGSAGRGTEQPGRLALPYRQKPSAKTPIANPHPHTRSFQ
jgi:hypothetical protein